MKKIFFSVIAVAGMLAAQAQSKEGSITYAVKAEGLPQGAEAFMAGAESKMYFKEKKHRMEFTTAMFSSITISDDKQVTTYDDQMGQKTYYTRKKESIEKEMKAEKREEPKITYIDEKKTIAGYECKKAIIEEKNKKGETEKVTVWYTDKLQRPETANSAQSGMKNLKGVPLEFEMNQGMLKMHFTASNVSTTPVPDAKFSMPTDGYTETSYEEIKKKREEMRKAQGGGTN